MHDNGMTRSLQLLHLLTAASLSTAVYLHRIYDSFIRMHLKDVKNVVTTVNANERL